MCAGLQICILGVLTCMLQLRDLAYNFDVPKRTVGQSGWKYTHKIKQERKKETYAFSKTPSVCLMGTFQKEKKL